MHRYYLVLLVLLAVSALGYCSYFMYQYVYLTIYHYDEISRQFQSTHAAAGINTVKFQAIIDNIENKSTPGNKTDIKSIF